MKPDKHKSQRENQNLGFLKPGGSAAACLKSHPVLERQRQVELREFKVSLVYIVSSRTPRAI